MTEHMKKMKGIKEKQLNRLTMIQLWDLQNTIFFHLNKILEATSNSCLKKSEEIIKSNQRTY